VNKVQSEKLLQSLDRIETNTTVMLNHMSHLIQLGEKLLKEQESATVAPVPVSVPISTEKVSS
jgi:hypothetical protein